MSKYNIPNSENYENTSKRIHKNSSRHQKIKNRTSSTNEERIIKIEQKSENEHFKQDFISQQKQGRFLRGFISIAQIALLIALCYGAYILIKNLMSVMFKPLLKIH